MLLHVQLTKAVRVPIMLLTTVLVNLSKSEIVAYAMTCKRNAREVLTDNRFWKKVTLFPDSTLPEARPEWTLIKSLLSVAMQLESVAARSKHIVLWSTALQDILGYLGTHNVYKGPVKPIN